MVRDCVQLGAGRNKRPHHAYLTPFKENTTMKRLVMFVTILALALLLVACGGDEDNGGETAALSFEGTDSLQFNPATASVPAGSEVTVTFNNGPVRK
jgi:hypothetical protein